jgi:lipopolysaccharide/colanic/teichoic acid biosynthesis glycosyltransferase
MIRILDILFSLIGLLILLPFFMILSIAIVLETRGGVFYKQIRVGRNGKDFKLFKFRSMVADSDKNGLLTIGEYDNRITKVGRVIRKYKLDEFAQLINVLKGDMSLVGPRPEVRKYVDMYNHAQKKVLSVKPGITDYASIEYSNENEVLAKSINPEKTYIEEVMPHKLDLNMKYINNRNVFEYLRIIFLTVYRLFF